MPHSHEYGVFPRLLTGGLISSALKTQQSDECLPSMAVASI